MLFITGDRGFQAAVVVFGLLAGYGFRACTANGSGQVSAHLVFHIAGYIIEELAANGVGHITGCFVHQVFGAVGDSAAICIIGNAVSLHYTLYLAIIANLAGERFSGLQCIGPVCSVSSVGVESFIAQVGGSGVLPVGSGALDSRFCLVNGGCIVPILDALQNLLQVLGDVGFLIFISQTGNCRIRSTCSHDRYIRGRTIGCRVRSTFFS